LAESAGDTCVDLYSGVGLFAVALAARGSRVIAVEGDPVSGGDLRVNAAPLRATRVGCTQSNMSTPSAIIFKICGGVPSPIV
jgi:tRNA/tmRNA/rRNA uracil-C5-methylase (TrmA/RlmC/RlmD family)